MTKTDGLLNCPGTPSIRCQKAWEKHQTKRNRAGEMVIPTARVAVEAQPTFRRGSERKTSGSWGSDGWTRELARQSLDLGFGSHMHVTFP